MNTAIFFDAENVSPDKIPSIIADVSKEGNILFQRAYADWSRPELKGWEKQLSRIPMAAMQVFHEKKRESGDYDSKESVDKVIMMDCIDLANKNQEIDTFVLISSDNGYYILALKLRELGKRVIGFGEKDKCYDRWVKSCNAFRYFEDLKDEDGEEILLSSVATAESKELQDFSREEFEELQGFSLEKFLEEAYDSTPRYKDTDIVVFNRFWESVLRLKNDINVKNYGFKSPLEFTKSFSEKFEITDDGNPQGTIFIKKKKDEINSDRKKGKIKRFIKYFCIIGADDGGDYFLYNKDINSECKDYKLEKGLRVDFAVAKKPNPDAAETKDRNGKAVDARFLD